MPCRVADDPVVVWNSQSEKPGNRVEEKTERTGTSCAGAGGDAKSAISCEGVKFNRKSWRQVSKDRGEETVYLGRQVVTKSLWEQSSLNELLSSE